VTLAGNFDQNWTFYGGHVHFDDFGFGVSDPYISLFLYKFHNQILEAMNTMLTTQMASLLTGMFDYMLSKTKWTGMDSGQNYIRFNLGIAEIPFINFI